VRPAPKIEVGSIDQMVRDLDSENFNDRQKASQGGFADPTGGLVWKPLPNNTDPGVAGVLGKGCNHGTGWYRKLKVWISWDSQAKETEEFTRIGTVSRAIPQDQSIGLPVDQ
jgi:hypothetical protein